MLNILYCPMFVNFFFILVFHRLFSDFLYYPLLLLVIVHEVTFSNNIFYFPLLDQTNIKEIAVIDVFFVRQEIYFDWKKITTKKDKKFLKNGRPISLLNTDLNLFSKVLHRCPRLLYNRNKLLLLKTAILAKESGNQMII